MGGKQVPKVLFLFLVLPAVGQCGQSLLACHCFHNSVHPDVWPNFVHDHYVVDSLVTFFVVTYRGKCFIDVLFFQCCSQSTWNDKDTVHDI